MWGPNGVISKLTEKDFQTRILSDLFLCDPRTEELLHRPGLYVPRIIVSDTKLKDVIVDVGVSDGLFIEKLKATPDCPPYVPLRSVKPSDYSRLTAPRGRNLDMAWAAPNQPNAYLNTQRNQYN